MVSYKVVAGKNGKPRAEKVRFPGQFKPGSLSAIFTSLFVCFLVGSAYLGRISWLVPVVYGAVSSITFLAYGWDKLSARLGNWRTRESALQFMALVGGWPGGLAAQKLLRHKSSKQEFLNTFWVTVFLNLLVIGYLVWSGSAGSLNQQIDEVWQNVVLQIDTSGV